MYRTLTRSLSVTFNSPPLLFSPGRQVEQLGCALEGRIDRRDGFPAVPPWRVAPRPRTHLQAHGCLDISCSNHFRPRAQPRSRTEQLKPETFAICRSPVRIRSTPVSVSALASINASGI